MKNKPDLSTNISNVFGLIAGKSKSEKNKSKKNKEINRSEPTVVSSFRGVPVSSQYTEVIRIHDPQAED
jgi:hypothetical protein